MQLNYPTSSSRVGLTTIAAVVLVLLLASCGGSGSSPNTSVGGGTGGNPGVPLPPTFFGIGMKQSADPFPPTDSNGHNAPAKGLRLWDSGVHWSQVETLSANYDWTTLDFWVNTAAIPNGYDIIYTFGSTPDWTSCPGGGCTVPSGGCANNGSFSCLPPTDVNTDGTGTDAMFQAFVTAVVSRYKGKIAYYELWNEPDSSNYWFGNTAQMVRMNTDAAVIIRATDPAAKILSPSFHGPSASTWFTTWLSAGGKGIYDINNFHGRSQGAANADPESFLTVYAEAVAGIQAGSVANLPLWDSEFGYLFETGITDQNTAASYVARAYILRASVGLPRAYWYVWDNGPAIPSLQGTKAGTAYTTVAGWLTGGTSSACTAAGTIYTCPITLASGAAALMAWDTSQTCNSTSCTTASHSFGSQYTNYTDSFGNASATAGNAVPVGLQPILLTPSGH